MVNVPAASSEPAQATALGTFGSSISERIKTKAPPSCHSNDVRPWNVVPGMSGCVPVVRHWPTNGASCSSAGFVRCASGPIGVAIGKIIVETQHDHATSKCTGAARLGLPGQEARRTDSEGDGYDSRETA